ncbi:MAG: hypothetical protein J6Y17_01200 [Elusimicrobiaceae bacterium]|nr:hypothetical protein [Elusimicrobiaceae bacterium]
MLHSTQGSIYRTVLAIFIAFAFCFALSWPQYAKYRNGKHLNQAAEFGRALAFAEGTYKQQHGQYTPLFGQLDVPLPCPMVNNGQGPHLDCHDYIYQLQENGIIRVSHKQLPVWLEVNIEAGDVTCQHPQNDWAGQDLCARMQ